VCFDRTGISREEVDVVFAPAPSVPAFDRAIAASLGRALSTEAGGPAITASRSVIGHTHAASAALDSVAAVQSLHWSRVPATLNLHAPIADLAFVRGTAREAPVATAVVGAYGFGGHAAALVWRRFQA
jgi:3-oxoacyl-[acyl-carrier-protein] synthase II